MEGDNKSNDGKIEVVIENNAKTNILGNEDRLSQVFGNLISNALSFSPADQLITLTIKNDSYNNMIETWVEDRGPGIPENKIETIFERFYTERPQDEAYGGHSGLGLSISKQIIDAHEGEILAENIYDSDENKIGARFIVRLKKA